MEKKNIIFLHKIWLSKANLISLLSEFVVKNLVGTTTLRSCHQGGEGEWRGLHRGVTLFLWVYFYNIVIAATGGKRPPQRWHRLTEQQKHKRTLHLKDLIGLGANLVKRTNSWHSVLILCCPKSSFGLQSCFFVLYVVISLWRYYNVYL